MLYTFKSKAAANLIMLQPNGERMLEIIGKDVSAKGILLPEHMPAAIAALEAALARDGAVSAPGTVTAGSDGTTSVPGERISERISLRQRVVPFLDMLRRSHQAGEAVVWGV